MVAIETARGRKNVYTAESKAANDKTTEQVRPLLLCTAPLMLETDSPS